MVVVIVTMCTAIISIVETTRGKTEVKKIPFLFFLDCARNFDSHRSRASLPHGSPARSWTPQELPQSDAAVPLCRGSYALKFSVGGL